jgi:hypothetical protein
MAQPIFPQPMIVTFMAFPSLKVDRLKPSLHPDIIPIQENCQSPDRRGN